MSRALPLAVVAAVLLIVPAVADPLKLTPGTPVMLKCETQSVVLIPEAASSTGEIRLKLELRDNTGPDQDGVWSVAAIAASHTASFAVRGKDTCAAGCFLNLGKGARFELWSPRRVSPASMPAGEPLTVIAIDTATLKLTASTTISNAIAALEKGDCKVAE